ncbi:MAG: hypothetical protein SFU56_05395 [Capsulimonadales bacterium]|nr:hypothetical protein [Capsulimonadales bacterium]
MNIQGLIIDPQRDFCDPVAGTLYVPGAEKDMDRLAAMLRTIGARIDGMHVTLDTHHPLHIAHPLWWEDARGNRPSPFTIITADDVAEGHWRAVDPAERTRSEAYVAALARNGRYPLCIWPYHCLIGTTGHAVFPPLADALAAWEEKRMRPVDYVLKGRNLRTEHYSALAADVPDPDDPTTAPNRALIDSLRNADIVFVAGEAGSHCVANTVRDLAGFLKQETGDDRTLSKLVLLTDTISPVGGFETLQETFIDEMTGRGMRTMTADAFAREWIE